MQRLQELFLDFMPHVNVSDSEVIELIWAAQTELLPLALKICMVTLKRYYNLGLLHVIYRSMERI